jgi:FtsP/CotA-like multicopper oxidase with cupredoxin domain
MNFPPNPCSGWTVTATFDGFQAPVTIGSVDSHGSQQWAFDVASISPTISVQPGDRVIVTITFTVA